MSDNKIQILKRFKITLINFIDELIGQFPQDSELILIRIYLKDQMPIQDIMNNFLYKLVEGKKLIKERNEMIFETSNDFFSFSDKAGLNNLKKSWRNGELDEDDKKTIWKWLDSFVFLCEKYQNSK